jgi:restriction system protein
MAKRAAEPIEGAQFVRYFGPVLDALRALGGSGRPSEVVEQVAEDLELSEEVQMELLDSGAPRFPNQVAWARFYLTREGLLDKSKRGVWSLTERGRHTQLSMTEARDLFLKWVKVFRDERRRRKEAEPTLAGKGASGDTTEESAPRADDGAAEGHRERLLKLLLDLPSSGFEQLCRRLLREAGFVQVVVTGSSGDGGIDGHGTLQVNPLVSFKVLFQCKRYSKSVTPTQVRDFRGAMQGRADKGIILTTGTFTVEAKREALRDGVPQIELVDGEKLLQMFEDLELGLKRVTAYDIDDAFFDEFRSRKPES